MSVLLNIYGGILMLLNRLSMETLEISVEKEYNRSEKEYNKSLLKTVATLYSLHNELLVQLTNLLKYNESNRVDKYITDLPLVDSDESKLMDASAQDLIELIALMKQKMNILLNR